MRSLPHTLIFPGRSPPIILPRISVIIKNLFRKYILNSVIIVCRCSNKLDVLRTVSR